MMQAIKNKGLEEQIYLWSDDNLSNDYLWKFLNSDQIALMISYKMYSRVCCFKGIDESSFSLNTKANPELFNHQFELCRRLIDLGIDLYCYVTLTAETKTDFSFTIPKFLDKIQKIHEMLPLRIVPLKISQFTPVKSRMDDTFNDMIKGQFKALEVWQKELENRFTSAERGLQITEVTIN
jgi:hypothetical protein